MEVKHDMKLENLQRTKHTRTEEQRAADDRALLGSGEPLATLAEVAAMIGISAKNVRRVLSRDDARPVRYVKATSESPSRFAVADVKAAVEPHRQEIEERQRRAMAQAAQESAAARAKKTARAVAHATHVAAKAGRPPRRSAASTGAGSRAPGPGKPASKAHATPFPARPDRGRPEPEVIVVRRRPGPTL
jgi:prophage antirepressor-like protein